MNLTIASPAPDSMFTLGAPITFRGGAANDIVKVDLFAEQFFLGSDSVERNTWAVTYPGFNQPGKRTVRVVGYDSIGDTAAASELTILLSNASQTGFEPGIDVSDFDDFVNWQKVRNAGFSFAFAKATEGGTFRADTFPGNWRRMQGAGVIRGAYHFFRPTVDAEAQARNFLDYINSVESIQADDLPPVLDLEHFPASVRRQWESISKTTRVSRVKKWIKTVEDETRRRPIIYTSFGFWNGFMSGVKDFANYPLWVAHYTQRPQPLIPREWANWTFWQYTDSTEIPGIPTPGEDGNRFNGSLDELLSFIKLSTIT